MRKFLRILLILAVVFAAGLASVTIYNQRAQHTNEVRRHDIAALAKTLQAQKGNGNYPTTPPTALPGLPYAVSQDGQQFVACLPLQDTLAQKVFARHDAMFVTQKGSFEAERRGCKPDLSPEVAAIAVNTTMTNLGAHLYYGADPAIADKITLQRVCAGSVHDAPERVQFAGCYSGQIYILQIDSPDVAPEMNVTAAHEMLHVAYQKLSRQERDRINGRLVATMDALNDPELKKEMDLYAPKDRVDELHSRLGTERIDLPPDLEEYYRRYFANRKLFAASHQHYENLLNGLTAQIDQMDPRLKSLKQQADSALTAGRIDAYNALVDPYNNLLAERNRLAKQYNSLTAHTRPENEQLKNQ